MARHHSEHGEIADGGVGHNKQITLKFGRLHTYSDAWRNQIRQEKPCAWRRGVSIQTVHADLAAYTPESDAFSALVMIFAQTPPHVRQHSLTMARQALKPGGYLILEGYTEDQIGRETGVGAVMQFVVRKL